MTVHPAKPKKTVEYPCLPTVGRNTAAMLVETAWLISRAMLMPLERMRVGINSESASQTHTPGPTAKKAMNENRQRATSQPLTWPGTGMISACSIFNGAVRAAARSAKGLENHAITLLTGTQPS